MKKKPKLTCAYCGGGAQGNYAVHRDGMDVGPEVELCDACGSGTEPTLADRRDLILEHFRMVAEREEGTFALHKLRKFTGWYTHGLPNGRKLRQAINQIPDVPTFLATVESFLGEILVERAA